MFSNYILQFNDKKVMGLENIDECRDLDLVHFLELIIPSKYSRRLT
jgi:hypothetical protein